MGGGGGVATQNLGAEKYSERNRGSKYYHFPVVDVLTYD
jgi:hypothetical protein